MRDYTRKAKRVDNGEWIIGCLLEIVDGTYRIATSCLEGDSENLLNVCCYEVIPETICDPTGLTDKNSNKIWENDIIADKHYKYSVVWDEEEGSWMLETISRARYGLAGIGRINSEKFEVIGNVFDNAELVKE